MVGPLNIKLFHCFKGLLKLDSATKSALDGMRKRCPGHSICTTAVVLSAPPAKLSARLQKPSRLGSASKSQKPSF